MKASAPATTPPRLHCEDMYAARELAKLDAFLRDIGASATLLLSEEKSPAQAAAVQSLGWPLSVQRGFGFGTVYAHQAETYQRLRAGEHVIITTPTASGKTGAFFPVAFEALERDPQATALFVYPLVALAQDQREKLLTFKARGSFGWGVGEFQGSAAPAQAFAPGNRMVTATPDKLHWNLTHPAVQEFLRHLRFLVLDEAHTYRGGFGSEVAGMLRRLLDLARALGANSQVVMSTATIGNPAEFARELTGLTFSEVSVSGAAKYGKRFYLLDHKGNPRRFWDSVVDSAIRRELKVLAFFRGRSRASRLYHNYLGQKETKKYVSLYMAGTSDREGRLSHFRNAPSGVMFATNALEAGVDIGDLEVVILDGYPGTRMAFRQMAGRAGRVSPGLALFLPALDERGLPLPADAFYSNQDNFRALMRGEVEKAVIEAANPYIAPRHERRHREELYAAGLLTEHPPATPHWLLRGEGSAKYSVVDEEEWNGNPRRALDNPLESPSQHYAQLERHVDAVFHLEGKGYRVSRWQPVADSTAIIAAKYEAGDRFTRGLHHTSVRELRMTPWEKRGAGSLATRFGEVEVQQRYTGYQMMREVFERACSHCDHPPALNDQHRAKCGRRIQDRMQAQKLSEHLYKAPIVTPPFETVALEIGIDPKATEEPVAVAHTLKHLLQKLIPERVACDENDIAGAFKEGHNIYFFIYDDWQGGLGVTRRAHEQLSGLLERALELCRKPCCVSGCYECIAVSRCFAPFLPSGDRRPTDKAATRLFLEQVLYPQMQPSNAPEEAKPRALSLALQARELLDLRGLSITEVSSRLGVPSRDIPRLAGQAGPLQLQHPKFGRGIFEQGFYQGERREVLVYFPEAGRKRLILKHANVQVIDPSAEKDTPRQPL